MPNQTPNLNLTKPLQTEYYNIDVHNANSDIIDTAIGSINTDKSDKLTAGSGIILTSDTVNKRINIAVDPVLPAPSLVNKLTINGKDFDGSSVINIIVGDELGSIKPWLAKTAPSGWIALDTGALVSRTTYATLWAWVQANAPLISETDWQTQAAAQTSVDSYSTGDGSTTFRLPKLVRYNSAKRYVVKEDHGLTGTFTVSSGSTINCTNFWYRLYNDGFLEQGGTLTQTVAGNNTYGSVTLPIEFKDTLYEVYRNTQYASAYDTSYSNLSVTLNSGCGTKTTTSIVFGLDSLIASRSFNFIAYGYAKNLPTAAASNMLYCVKAVNYILK